MYQRPHISFAFITCVACPMHLLKYRPPSNTRDRICTYERKPMDVCCGISSLPGKFPWNNLFQKHLFFIIIVCICVGFSVCIPPMRVFSDPLELELQAAVLCHAGAREWTWVLYKGNKLSYLPSYPLSLHEMVVLVFLFMLLIIHRACIWGHRFLLLLTASAGTDIFNVCNEFVLFKADNSNGNWSP